MLSKCLNKYAAQHRPNRGSSRLSLEAETHKGDYEGGYVAIRDEVQDGKTAGSVFSCLALT